MSKISKILILSIVVILSLVILIIGKFSLSLFKLFDDIKTTSISYELLEKDFFLKNQDNFEYQLVFNDSTKYLIHFWATWCKPCISEFDSIEKYHKSWKNVQLLMVTLESHEKMNTFLKDKKWNLPFYTTDSLQLPFSPKSIKYYPTTFSIKKDSLDVAIGPIEWNQAYK